MRCFAPHFQSCKAALESTTVLCRALIDQLPRKGNTAQECQRVAITNALNNLEQCVSGLAPEDFVPSQFSGDVVRDPKAIAKAIERIKSAVV